MPEERPVSTDALKTLGTILGNSVGINDRDAIHLAVLPAIAAVRLGVGERVTFRDGKAHPDRNGVGIVDPFLDRDVEIGEKFWYVLRPRQIASLRHVWSHPAFPDEAPQNALPIGPSMAFMAEFAMSAAISVPVLMEAAKDWIDNWQTFSEGDSWRHDGREVPDEFWFHYERITGKPVPTEKRQSFFSCPC